MARTWFMQQQEARMDDSSKAHDAALEAAIRAGEVAYDPDYGMWVDPLHGYEHEDFSQRKLTRWQREGRIVVDGRVVRMATGGGR